MRIPIIPKHETLCDRIDHRGHPNTFQVITPTIMRGSDRAANVIPMTKPRTVLRPMSRSGVTPTPSSCAQGSTSGRSHLRGPTCRHQRATADRVARSPTAKRPAAGRIEVRLCLSVPLVIHSWFDLALLFKFPLTHRLTIDNAAPATDQASGIDSGAFGAGVKAQVRIR